MIIISHYDILSLHYYYIDKDKGDIRKETSCRNACITSTSSYISNIIEMVEWNDKVKTDIRLETSCMNAYIPSMNAYISCVIHLVKGRYKVKEDIRLEFSCANTYIIPHTTNTLVILHHVQLVHQLHYTVYNQYIGYLIHWLQPLHWSMGEIRWKEI